MKVKDLIKLLESIDPNYESDLIYDGHYSDLDEDNITISHIHIRDNSFDLYQTPGCIEGIVLVKNSQNGLLIHPEEK